MTEPLPEGTKWVVTITATGEVRDADGNLLNTVPIEATRTVTAEEAAQILADSGATPPAEETP